jgi:hypothetical protein
MRPKRAWSEPPPAGHEGDRNGEPCEEDWGCLLYAIVLAALALVVGFELGLLFWFTR